MADYLTGLMGGFLGAKQDLEKRNFDLGQQQTAQESAIFSHLMASDDPEIRTLALTGLLDTANPRKKKSGLAGWIGQTQSSPYLAQMRSLVNTPVQQPTQIQLPGDAQGLTNPISGMDTVKPTITQTPGAAPAAMPATSMVDAKVQQTGPPPPPQSYTQGATIPGNTISRMRNVFLTGADKVNADKVAAASGDIEGEVAGLKSAGFSDADARQMIRQRFSRQYAGQRPQSIRGEMPDPDHPGSFMPAFGVFTNGTYVHPDTGQPLAGFRPLTATSTTSLGVQIEPLARVMYGKPGAALTQAEIANVYEASQLQKSALTVPQALQAVDRLIPNGTVEQKMQLADALRSGTAAPVTPQGTAAAGGPPPPTATASPTAPTTPPAPTGAMPPPGAPTTGVVAPTTGTPGGPPKPGTLTSAIPGNFGTATRETGKPPAPAVQAAVARTQQMNDIIDKALVALGPYKHSTSLDDTAKLVEHYRQGTEGDPFSLAAAQLPDLAGLQQAASATLGGTSRSQRIYADKRQHVPRLPSGRQVMIAEHVPGMNANRVNAASQLLKGDEGGFDSPAQMYLKLKGLRDANDAFLRDMTNAAQMQLNPIAPVSSHAPTGAAGGPPSPTTIGAPGQAYQDPKTGQWMIP